MSIKSKTNVQLRISHISSIMSILLSKNSHLLEQDPNCETSKTLMSLRKQISDQPSLIEAILELIIKDRLNIADSVLISSLKSLAWASKNQV